MVMILSDEYMRDHEKFLLDFRRCDRKAPVTQRLESMMCERRIVNSLRQINRMLDKMNATTDVTIIEKCKQSIARERKNLMQAEYW
jgi:hypothetical protein